jgi:hypothetical protein
VFRFTKPRAAAQFGDQRLFSMKPATAWLTAGFCGVACDPNNSSGVNLVLNRLCLQRRESEVGGVS